MSFWDWLKIAANITGSFGGILALIGILATWSGNRIAEKMSNDEKAKHAQELEILKSQLEITKSMVARYSEQQFDIYNQLWSSLFELFSIGDELWKHADEQKLLKFAKQLRTTKDAVGKGSLFVEDEHYQQLQDILNIFSNYQAGKEHLLDLRKADSVGEYEIQQIVANRNDIDRYIELIPKIRDSFRRQLNVKIN